MEKKSKKEMRECTPPCRESRGGERVNPKAQRRGMQEREKRETGESVRRRETENALWCVF